MLAGYQSVRPLSDAENAWPVLLRAAGLRFWTSRLYDKYLPQAGELTFTKDRRSSSELVALHPPAPGFLAVARLTNPSWRCYDFAVLPALSAVAWPASRGDCVAAILAGFRMHAARRDRVCLTCAPCWGEVMSGEFCNDRDVWRKGVRCRH